MRVLHVLHNMSFGGAEVLVYDFVRATRETTTPSLACLDGVGPLGERLRNDGVRVEHLHRSPGLDVRVIARLRTLIQESRPDVVCAHQYTAWSYAAMALTWLRSQPALVFVEHGRHYPDHRRSKRIVANRLSVLHRTQRVVAVCSYIKQLLVENEGIPASRIEVVYNGVDPAKFDQSVLPQTTKQDIRTELGLTEQHQVVTCVARMHPVKDHPTLVRGFAHAAQHHHQARLLLVGGGEAEPLRALARDLGVGDRVIFAGVRQDIPSVYAASDIFAMASLSEGTSVTLLESMLLELPSVVTDVGGNPEIVERNATGLLTPRGDAEALGASLSSLLRQPDQRAAMGKRGRARVLQHFTQQRMHAGWLGALSNAAAMAPRET
jgi:L-malate glycosyltransferase